MQFEKNVVTLPQKKVEFCLINYKKCMKQYFLVAVTVFFASFVNIYAQTVRQFVIEQLQTETAIYAVSCGSPSQAVIVFRTAIIGLNITMSPPSALINVNHNRQRNEYVLCVEPTDRRYRITITHPEFVGMDFTVEDVAASQVSIYLLNPSSDLPDEQTSNQINPIQTFDIEYDKGPFTIKVYSSTGRFRYEINIESIEIRDIVTLTPNLFRVVFRIVGTVNGANYFYIRANCFDADEFIVKSGILSGNVPEGEHFRIEASTYITLDTVRIEFGSN